MFNSDANLSGSAAIGTPGGSPLSASAGLGAQIGGSYQSGDKAARGKVLDRAKELGYDTTFGTSLATSLRAGSEAAGSYSGSDLQSYAKGVSSQLYLNSSGTTIGTLTYGYDAAGRRTSVGGTMANTTLPSPVSSAAYDANNRLSTWGNESAYQYDNDGNLLNDGASSYVWNARNQLATLNGNSFAYDAVGRRTGKTINGASTNYLYDEINVVQEIASGGVANDLENGTDELLSHTTSSTTTSILSDALGSTVAETNGSQSVTATYVYALPAAAASSKAAR